MNFGLMEEQDRLPSLVRKPLHDACAMAVVRRIAEQGFGLPTGH